MDSPGPYRRNAYNTTPIRHPRPVRPPIPYPPVVDPYTLKPTASPDFTTRRPIAKQNPLKDRDALLKGELAGAFDFTATSKPRPQPTNLQRNAMKDRDSLLKGELAGALDFAVKSGPRAQPTNPQRRPAQNFIPSIGLNAPPLREGKAPPNSRPYNPQPDQIRQATARPPVDHPTTIDKKEQSYPDKGNVGPIQYNAQSGHSRESRARPPDFHSTAADKKEQPDVDNGDSSSELGQVDLSNGEFAIYTAFHEKERTNSDILVEAVCAKLASEATDPVPEPVRYARHVKSSSTLRRNSADSRHSKLTVHECLPVLTSWACFESWSQRLESAIRVQGNQIVPKILEQCFVEGTQPWEWRNSLSAEILHSTKSSLHGWMILQSLMRAEVMTRDISTIKALGRSKLEKESFLAYAVTKLHLLANAFPDITNEQRIQLLRSGLADANATLYCKEDRNISGFLAQCMEFDSFSTLFTEECKLAALLRSSQGIGSNLKVTEKLQRYCTIVGLRAPPGL